MKVNKLPIVILGVFILVVIFLNNKTGSKLNSKQTSASNSNPSNNTLVDTALPVIIGTIAPDFSLTTLDKETIILSEKKGETIIIFGVAGWCGECIPEGKALTQVKKDYAQKGVEIIGVAFTKGDNNELLKQYKQVGGVDIPLALDTDNVAGKYQITKLETTYIINKEGKVVYKDERFTSYDDYKKELDKIL